jgi:hypothetical protein
MSQAALHLAQKAISPSAMRKSEALGRRMSIAAHLGQGSPIFLPGMG